MYPTRTDSDRKRLRRALASAVFLYALGAGVFLAIPAPRTGEGSEPVGSRPRLEAVRLTLSGQASAAGARGSPRTGETARLPELAFSGKASAADGTVSPDPAAAPARQAELPPGSEPGSIPGRDGIGGDDTAAAAGPAPTVLKDAVSPETFLSWLDRAIRDRLLYPERARRRNLQGTVELFLSVNADGSARDIRVVRSSGYPILDRDAAALVGSLFPAPVHPGIEFADTIRIVYVLEKSQP